MINKDTITQPTDAKEQVSLGVRYEKEQYNLGVMSFYGFGVPKDYEQAFKWFTKAAEQGYSYAQGSLGVMYENGIGCIKDYEQAVKWYTKSAVQGHSVAQSYLDDMNSRG